MIAPADVSVPVNAENTACIVSFVDISKLLGSPGGTFRIVRNLPVTSSKMAEYM